MRLLKTVGSWLALRALSLLTLLALVLLCAGLAFKFDAATAAIVTGGILLADIELLPLLNRRTR